MVDTATAMRTNNVLFALCFATAAIAHSTASPDVREERTSDEIDEAAPELAPKSIEASTASNDQATAMIMSPLRLPGMPGWEETAAKAAEEWGAESTWEPDEIWDPIEKRFLNGACWPATTCASPDVPATPNPTPRPTKAPTGASVPTHGPSHAPTVLNEKPDADPCFQNPDETMRVWWTVDDTAETITFVVEAARRRSAEHLNESAVLHSYGCTTWNLIDAQCSAIA